MPRRGLLYRAYFGVVTSYKHIANTLCGYMICEHRNKVELHNVLFTQATRKMTMNLHVAPKVYTSFSNARIGNVKRVSHYEFANIDDVKHNS